MKKYILGFNKIDSEKARLEVEKLAFGPFAFQAARILKKRGILNAVEKGGKKGKTLEEIKDAVDMSKYGISILLDAAESIGAVKIKKDRFAITKMGSLLLYDKVADIHFNLTQHVCYQGMYFLEDSIDNKKPEGLKVFGDWETIYDAVPHLPDKSKSSWLNFDHFFSSRSFPEALPIVFSNKPKKILDIGGNTGKWAIKCASYNPDVAITIADLPDQLNDAEKYIKNSPYSDRIDFFPINLLDHIKELPANYDAIWMSQFLDCFQPDDIISILKRAKNSLNENGRIYIMDLFVDKQSYNIARYCLNMVTLYFTALANGKSRMYHFSDMINFIEKAGLRVVKNYKKIGMAHSILKVSV